MLISYNWLKDFVDVDIPANDLARKLTNVGLAVDAVHEAGSDFVFDIDLTSNRPDCLSHLGVARELAVALDKPLNVPGRYALEDGQKDCGALVSIEEPSLCHRFTARIIRGVRIGPSPAWMVERLESIGERSINNVADITNYVMHELGQPMHAFDLKTLAGGRIVVRCAREGEPLTTLDEVERKPDTSMLMICDAEKAVSVAGIMGGFESSITDATTDVLLEVAYFDRGSIRATSRRLNLATEASYRFERGVDIENVVRASKRATELILELAGGEAGEFVDCYPAPLERKSVHSGDIAAAVRRLTGLPATTDECLRILRELGFSSDDGKTFTSPTWRHDVAIEEDLVEEVGRHIGYENLLEELPPALGAGEYQHTEAQEKSLRLTLTELGFDEAISYSFIPTTSDESIEAVPALFDENAAEKFITLQDSVIEGAVRMRHSILPGLLDAVRLNFNHQRRDLKLFEIGKVFASSSDEDRLPRERKLLGIALTGGELNENRALPTRPLDFYDIKGSVEGALEAIGFSGAQFAAGDVRHLRPGQTAVVTDGERTLGMFGRLSDELSAAYKFRQPVFVGEFDLQSLLALAKTRAIYRPLAKFPSVVRDVSFIGPRSVTFEQVRQAITHQNFELCRRVEFVDVYEGKGMSEGERSVTVRLEYRSDERTLIDEDVESIHSQIVAAVERSLGLTVRS